jgi:hypothetical protein
MGHADRHGINGYSLPEGASIVPQIGDCYPV